jgi:tetratricopeptide (TPR) repeat protein
VLVALSALAIATWRTRPYLAVGWFWYVGTLVPVIGLVQAGWQAHADRYTYIPMIGLSIIVAWGAADIVKQWPRLRFSVVAAAAGCSIVWMALASREASYWRDSETLYEHAIEVTEGNWAIEYELANYLRGIPRRRLDAIPHYRAAVQIWPGYAEAHRNLGLLLVAMPGGQAEALVHLEAAQRIQPDPGLEAMIDGLRGTGR